jgi:WD40 repeat protein
LWDLATWKPVRTLRFSEPVQVTAPSPDGRLLAVETQGDTSSSAHVAIVRLATGRSLQTHTIPHGARAVLFTPDNREVIAVGCCDGGSVVVSFDVRSGRRLARRTFADAYQTAAVDPRSGMIVLGGQNGHVLFLDPRTGRSMHPPLQASAGNIVYAAFSPDGRSLAVSGADNTVEVWDVRARKRLGGSFGPYPGDIAPVLFEPDGRLLIILLEQGVQWPMKPRSWERSACQVAGRDLTRAEWQDLLPSRPYQKVCPGNA